MSEEICECVHEWRCIQDRVGNYDFYFYCIFCKKIISVSRHKMGDFEK